MSTNNVIDIADFLKQKLENQQINPPENVWNEIQKEIPKYSAKGFEKWIWYSSIIILTVLSFAIYLSNQNTKTTTTAKSVAVSQISVPERTITHCFTNLNKTEPQSNHAIITSSQKVQTKLLENSTLHLEASVYSTIEKVEFIDSTHTIKKVILNPSANEFGFYVLDISSLIKGKYQIVIYSNNGKKFQRVENLY